MYICLDFSNGQLASYPLPPTPSPPSPPVPRFHPVSDGSHLLSVGQWLRVRGSMFRGAPSAAPRAVGQYHTHPRCTAGGFSNVPCWSGLCYHSLKVPGTNVQKSKLLNMCSTPHNHLCSLLGIFCLELTVFELRVEGLKSLLIEG